MNTNSIRKNDTDTHLHTYPTTRYGQQDSFPVSIRQTPFDTHTPHHITTPFLHKTNHTQDQTNDSWFLLRHPIRTPFVVGPHPQTLFAERGRCTTPTTNIGTIDYHNSYRKNKSKSPPDCNPSRKRYDSLHPQSPRVCCPRRMVGELLQCAVGGAVWRGLDGVDGWVE